MACDNEQGSWVTSACYFGCGGRCVNSSLVCEGRVIRQKTDDSHSDTPDNPQQRGCPRGRMLRRAMVGRDRLEYPLKRKHWQPGGTDVRGELRGADEWERISWDEALDIVAQETARIRATHGSKAILATGYELRPLAEGLYSAAALNASGGCTTTWGQASQGAFPLVANKMKGSYNMGRLDFSDRFTLRKARLIVMWGQNPAWSAAGNPTYHYQQAKRAGARIVFIDPWCNPTMQALADEWIPIRPGTDTALLLALADEMIRHDWQDREFLDTYCVGFDRGHMPEGIRPEVNFKDYVLGLIDGQEKTATWASVICGIEPDRIQQLAYEMTHIAPMTMRASQAPARTDNGYAFAQAFYTVGWMTGNVGIPGAEVAAGGSGGNMAFGGPALVEPGPLGFDLPQNPIGSLPRAGGALARGEYDPNCYYGICMSEMWDAVITGRYHDFAHGEQPIDIRMIWKVGVGHRMNQDPDFAKAVQAYRSVEFAVASDLWMNNDCLYSDIVLPAVSPYERDFNCATQMNREAALWSRKTVDPPAEARDDLWIEQQLASRWGASLGGLGDTTLRQIGFDQLSGARIVCEDQTQAAAPDPSDVHGDPRYRFEPLVSVTDDDLRELGVKGVPHKGRYPVREFLERGFVQVERHPGDAFEHVPYRAFRADPQACPLPTRSGRFEICCPDLVDAYRHFGFTEISPIARYMPARDGFEDEEAAADYPFQCISIHSLGRAHSTFYPVGELNEMFPNDVMVNSMDAHRLGIEDKSFVCVSSRFGRIVRRVSVTRLIMPGVVALGQGAWADLSDADGIDYAGCANTIQGSVLSGEGQSTWNTARIDIRSWNGPLPPADERRPRRFAGEGSQERSLTMVPSVAEALSSATVEETADAPSRASAAHPASVGPSAGVPIDCTPSTDARGKEAALEASASIDGTKKAAFGFAFDPASCIACHSCVAACMDVHDSAVGEARRHVLTFERGSWGLRDGLPVPVGISAVSLSLSCNHCMRPACVAACPRKAICKDAESGRVVIDEDRCIGCGRCAKACPYDAPTIVERRSATGNPKKPARVSVKCDGCADIPEGPACEAACLMRCLHAGDIYDLRKRYGSCADGPHLPPSSQTGPSFAITGPGKG